MSEADTKMEVDTESHGCINGESYAGGGSEADTGTHAKVTEPRGNAKAMEPGSSTEAGGARGASVVTKCKGKYRIYVKGASCHGMACCRET